MLLFVTGLIIGGLFGFIACAVFCLAHGNSSASEKGSGGNG